MKQINLSRGKVALVDDEDFEALSKFKWNAWCSNVGKKQKFYATRNKSLLLREGRGRIYMHRLILNAPKGLEVDHIDGDTLNNQRSNLRICSHSENCKNMMRHSDKETPFKGVYPTRNKFRKFEAKIYFSDSRGEHSVWLGSFTTEKEAAEAYNKAAKEFHGEYAQMNIL